MRASALGVWALLLVAACSGSSEELEATPATAVDLSPVCDHQSGMAEQLELVPGRYSTGPGLGGEYLDLAADGLYWHTEWGCFGTFAEAGGTWRQDGTRVAFNNGLGGSTPGTLDVVLTSDGVLALHWRLDGGLCNAMAFQEPDPSAILGPSPPTAEPPPPGR